MKKENDIEEQLNKVPKENDSLKENNNQTREGISVQTVQQTLYSGPLPHPDILKEYKKIYKDAPEIIFEVFKKEQENRYKTIKFGQYSALMIGISGLISTTLLGIYGNPWVAGSIGFLSLSSLVGAFLYNKSNGK